MSTAKPQPKPPATLAIYQQRMRIKDLRDKLHQQEWQLNCLLSRLPADSRLSEKIVVDDTVFLVTAINPRHGAASCEIARIGAVSELKDLIKA